MSRKRKKIEGLAGWIERTVHLPQGLAAEPGRVKLWPWQRAIADAISDPALERVTLLKPTRVYKTLPPETTPALPSSGAA